MSNKQYSSVVLDLIKINTPLIWAYSRDEMRFIVDESTALMSGKRGVNVYIYDVRGSIYDVHAAFSSGGLGQSKEYDSIVEAIEDFSGKCEHEWDDVEKADGTSTWNINDHGYPESSVLIMLDAPAMMTDPSKVKHTNAMLARVLKSASIKNAAQRKTIVIVNHHNTIPVELESFVTYVEHPLPTSHALRSLVMGAKDMLKNRDSKISSIPLDEEGAIHVAQQLKGLTMWQAEHVLAQANRQNALDVMHGHTKVREFKAEVIQKEKARLIATNGAIEIVESKFGLDGVGGVENFKSWIKDREIIFRHEAREEGIDLPKGILLVGPGGTGKSLLCQAVAGEWNRPLLRLDISACMGSLLGESESKLIKALKDAEAQAPCILFVDRQRTCPR